MPRGGNGGPLSAGRPWCCVPTTPARCFRKRGGTSFAWARQSAREPAFRTRGRVGPIRPATRDDIPQIAALRSRVLSWRRKDSAEARETALQRVFFDNPFCDERLPSLVCENDGGGILGFVGVSARRLRWQGAELCAAVSHGLMVDPESRGVAGLRLFQRLLHGPQDNTVAGSPDHTARRLMGPPGGLPPPPHSPVSGRPAPPA